MVRPAGCIALRRRWVVAVVIACASCATGAKPRTGRDWSKLTDKDWERIESDWETPEEKEEYEFKPPPQKGVDMEKLQKAMKKSKGKSGKKANADVQVRRLSFIPCPS